MTAFRMPAANGGSFRPRVKFNAKAGRVYRIDRVPQADGRAILETEITAQFAFFLALESFADGWWNRETFKELLVALGGVLPPQPDGRDEKGKPIWVYQVRCAMKLAAAAGGDLRVFSSGAQCVLEPLDRLYHECTADAKGRGDERRRWVPAVRMVRTDPIKGENGVNYAPVFEVVKWVERPADMPYEPAGTPEAAPAAAPPTATRSTAPPSNGTPQAAAEAAAFDDLFGDDADLPSGDGLAF